MLSNHLEEREVDHLLTREPGGTPIGDQIRRLVLDAGNADMTPVCDLLLYAAARAQHIEQVIRPALEVGRLVLCDRFKDATFAYQGYGRGVRLDLIDALHGLETLALRPDLTLLFDLDASVALERARDRDSGPAHDQTRFEQTPLQEGGEEAEPAPDNGVTTREGAGGQRGRQGQAAPAANIAARPASIGLIGFAAN